MGATGSRLEGALLAKPSTRGPGPPRPAQWGLRGLEGDRQSGTPERASTPLHPSLSFTPKGLPGTRPSLGMEGCARHSTPSPHGEGHRDTSGTDKAYMC